MHLIIAEKDKAASRIAEILSGGKVKKERVGRINIYKITLDGQETVVIPLSGHILDVTFDKDFSSWKESNLHDIVSAGFIYKPTRRDIAKALKDYATKADRVTIATDFDREGESIGREALNIIRQANPQIAVDRARFSAITPPEIKKAFSPGALHPLDEALADSADARREVDLSWGAVLTRFISLASGRLGKQFLSVGRVQTPTLALIINREEQITKFKPQKYWTVQATLEKGLQFNATYREEKIKEREKVQEILAKLNNASQGKVKRVLEREKKQKRPVPFNTNEFLRAAANIGISPSQAMQIAENLYMSGFISYPRTDNTVYPKTLNLKAILETLAASKEFGNIASEILSFKRLSPTMGKTKSTDHPPIHPTGLAKRHDLDPKSWKIYELVVLRFLATLHRDARLSTKKVEIDIKGEQFQASGQTILDPGWLAFYKYSKVKESQLPDLHKDDLVHVLKIQAIEKETQPPSRYTPASLLKEMEKLGLGTKSTRPTIIQKLIDRNYMQGRRNYQPSKVAFKVIEALEKHASIITKPEMTARLEEEMDEVAQGKKKKETVVFDSKAMLESALSELETHKEAIGKEVREGLAQDARAKRVLGPCPKCGGELVIRVSKRTGKRFAACSNYPECNVTFPLPQKGEIKPTGKVCSECDTPIITVRFRRGKYSKRYTMCLDPNCKTKENWGKKNEG